MKMVAIVLDEKLLYRAISLYTRVQDLKTKTNDVVFEFIFRRMGIRIRIWDNTFGFRRFYSLKI